MDRSSLYCSRRYNRLVIRIRSDDHVYHSAFVTFCSLTSTSCHESLLNRARTVTIPFQSTIRPMISGYLSVRLQPIPGPWSVRAIYHLDIGMSRWNRRVWTYQEEVLSNRLLLLGGSKMHFRCGTHQWSEGEDRLTRLRELSFLIHDRITGIKQGEFPVTSLY